MGSYVSSRGQVELKKIVTILLITVKTQGVNRANIYHGAGTYISFTKTRQCSSHYDKNCQRLNPIEAPIYCINWTSLPVPPAISTIPHNPNWWSIQTKCMLIQINYHVKAHRISRYFLPAMLSVLHSKTQFSCHGMAHPHYRPMTCEKTECVITLYLWSMWIIERIHESSIFIAP